MSLAKSSFLDELLRVSADLDELIADMTTGEPSPTRHDGYIDQAEQLAARLRQAARGPGRPINPPLAVLSDGTCVW